MILTFHSYFERIIVPILILNEIISKKNSVFTRGRRKLLSLSHRREIQDTAGLRHQSQF